MEDKFGSKLPNLPGLTQQVRQEGEKMEYALKLEKVSKTYKASGFSLRNVSMEVPAGSIVGFVGENGAGNGKNYSRMMVRDNNKGIAKKHILRAKYRMLTAYNIFNLVCF
ncbi:MAG TPA: hypothetical protein H9934_11690 [Candidatus Anaerobutyricum faecale]|uniref:hypothetical protein n=1 Tax=Eubacterium sp. An11 TaxID=1965542 RepID=UPI000B382259|nr:hypothetical protein [Eubacterium sp. An11]OUQ64125.1 hypothetical protein B5E53_14540 [Eubacterium sp. An11]HJC32777.1 hypothetical protein [Candidatus Anaerobutyricum faecale]